MPEIAHTMPLMVTSNEDLAMLSTCLSSLARSDPGGLLVAYNQGLLDNAQLAAYLSHFNLNTVILGTGRNVGIPRGRQICFEYLWSFHPEVTFISEIHVDMFFPLNWVSELTGVLKKYDEPMICPGILTSQGALHPETLETMVPGPLPLADQEHMLAILNKLAYPAFLRGFVHPVIHRAEALKAIGGYDISFLTGKQGYEDDSLLIGYRYYMGTRSNWVPKCCTNVRVYHATLAQRTSVIENFDLNLQGLIRQYGIQGIRELTKIHCLNQSFVSLLEQLEAGN
ncbi:MAG: hypothetical protein ACM3PP_08930 [Candidatus Saccharibacteria bacterium]